MAVATGKELLVRKVVKGRHPTVPVGMVRVVSSIYQASMHNHEVECL